MQGAGARQADSPVSEGPEVQGIERIAVLDSDERDRAAEQVWAQRTRWENRYPGLPFYTLGAASYLDSGAGKRDAYYEKAATLNPLLEREFDWLYERLSRALRDLLGAPVAFEPRAARPGFHIFLPHAAFRRPAARIHFDLQYEDLDWTGHDAMDFSRPFSYTLAVRLPRSGAGLLTWDIDKAEYDAMDAAARQRLGEERPPRYVAYREGELICHSGLLLHQIAPARPGMRADDARLTLQGHALPGREGYWLYW